MTAGTKPYSLVSVEADSGPVAAVLREGRVAALPGAPSMRAVLADWDAWLRRIESELLADGELERAGDLAEVALAAPLPEPRNLYMAGANYADHAREMRKLPADAPIEPSPHGPFFFLKPTSTVVGPGADVILPEGVGKLDWEVELAAVIGRPARAVAEADALDCVAGYTIVNDVSVRDRFKREPATEPPMTFDWFGQKGWASTCPMGPALVPARFVADPGALELSLRVDGELLQSSSTAEMIFSLPAQIAYLSRVVELLPGDVICTGTPAGVGMGRGRFLAAGETMVAVIDGLGELSNTVVADGRG
jgi:2-keto-4-pentenoate hydratase/2-oxohepta-3-ene-1,7-dioic acid hydratase in catechol pathway